MGTKIIPKPTNTVRGLPTNTHVSKTWVSNVGILPENKTHVLKTWVFLDTMKPAFRGGMKGGSNLFILFREALVPTVLSSFGDQEVWCVPVPVRTGSLPVTNYYVHRMYYVQRTPGYKRYCNSPLNSRIIVMRSYFQYRSS